jgi:hypothetical protein
MANHGYSENDVNLVKNWFFVDPKIANPEALNAMVRELGPLPLQARSAATGLEGLQSLLIPELLPLLACAAILLLLKPTWRTALILLSGALAVFAMGAMGRPGVSRVYFPMVSLLLMASLLPLKALSRRWLVPGLLLATSVANAYPVVMQARASSNAIRQARLDVAKLPRESIVIWGEGFPFEAAFPLFEGTGIARAPRLYGLGVFTLAPLSVATLDERSGNGFITRLNGSKGIEVIASSQRVDLLRTYCMEHWGRRLIESEAHQFPSFAIRRVRCE